MGERDELGSGFAAILRATFVTNLGDGLRLAALPVLATTLTSSPVLISGVTAAQFLPWTTFAPFGGLIVDRSDRRRLIMVTQAWRALLMAALTVAVLTDVVQIWHLFIVAFMITVGEILVDPSVVATVPKLVKPGDLDRANSRISTVEIVTNGFIGGPVGALSFGLAPWLPFLLDALSYGGSIIPFRKIPAEHGRRSIGSGDPASSAEGSSVWLEMGEGLQWIRQHPILLPLTAGIAVFHLGTAIAMSLLVLLVIDVLEAPRVIFGIVLSASAGGATLATLVAARLTDRFSRQIVITVPAALAAVCVVGAGLATNEWQLLPLWGLYGAATGILLSIGRGFVQRNTPDDRLGRTAVASRTITRTAFVVGAVLAGTIATVSSVRWSFVVAGFLHLAGAVLLWRSLRYESAANRADLQTA